MSNLIKYLNSSYEKIVVVVSSDVLGGHEQQALYLINMLMKYGPVTVICTNISIHAYFNKLRCSVVIEPFFRRGKFWSQLWYSRHTKKMFAKYVTNADLIFVSGGTLDATINPVYACKAISPKIECISYVPMYVDRSLVYGFVGRIYNYAIDFLGRKADSYCVINRIQASVFKRKLNSNVYIHRNTIREVSIPAQSFGKRLIYIGRFDDLQKNLSKLLLMLDVIDNPYRELIMIGSGPCEANLRKIASKSKFINVKFLTWLNSVDMDSAIGSNDCLILNSRWEGEPLVVREFLLRGLPCISRNIDGVRGLIPRANRFSSEYELIKVLNRIWNS